MINSWVPDLKLSYCSCGVCLAEKAFQMISRCSEIAPTVPEVYTVKSRILKHAGDVEGAAASAVRAQGLDLADRCSIPRAPIIPFLSNFLPSCL